MQKSTSTSVIPWSSALHIGVEPIHKERSESAVADSFAEIVEPSAFEVCEAAADPEISTFVSLTLTLSVNEAVEAAAACIVSIGLGRAFGLFRLTKPDIVSEILVSEYIAVEVEVGVGDAGVVEVEVAVAVGVALPLVVALGVAVGVPLGVAVTDDDGVGVGLGGNVDVPLALPLSAML